MSLMQAYEKEIEAHQMNDDPLQKEVIQALEQIDKALSSFRWSVFKGRKPVQGLYLYGPVGVGKTFLMNLFYQHLSTKKKQRFHYHHFMQEVDAQLRARQGERDPLKKIAKTFSKQSKILCLDEFIVYDIADAMILAELLKALFAHGVILVATSNTKPSSLYLKGLQRQRFLPAIALIEEHCRVMELGIKKDYRLNRERVLKAFLYPLNELAQQQMLEQFNRLEPNCEPAGKISIQKRFIPFISKGENTIWFDFNILCNTPRSQLDYLELASRFDTIFLSQMPKLKPSDTVKVILLMHLIDVMYDEGIRLIISAETTIDDLYEKGALHSEFQRTKSRLHEMQSKEYLT